MTFNDFSINNTLKTNRIKETNSYIKIRGAPIIMVVKYRFFHFNLRGRGEVIRMIFAAAEQEYEDVRFEVSEWSEYKSKSPLGHSPWLEIHDGDSVTVLGTSTAIGLTPHTR